MLADDPVESAGSLPDGAPHDDQDKLRLTAIAAFRSPISGQEIQLQQLDFAHGGISLLRVRIREGKRFTLVDIDPVTAGQWGELLRRWAAAQGAAGAA
ncbi:MAG: hypothetical protein LBE62_16400 [Azonexus sp.]|nr:hypothetical protein [Azonexus sp.]